MRTATDEFVHSETSQSERDRCGQFNVLVGFVSLQQDLVLIVRDNLRIKTESGALGTVGTDLHRGHLWMHHLLAQ